MPDDGEDQYDRLLRANLHDVFNERDPIRRATALSKLYVDDPTLYEPDNVVVGQAAISDVVGRLLERFGPDFHFEPSASAVGHHGMAALRWYAGPSGGPVVVTGTDMAKVSGGRIAQLWVLIDPPAG